MGTLSSSGGSILLPPYVKQRSHSGSSSQIDDNIKDGLIDIIYASPETLVGDPEWRNCLKKLNIKVIVIDEFHTIAIWGQGEGGRKEAFRKWFGNIKELRSLFPEAAVLALSATCTVNISQKNNTANYTVSCVEEEHYVPRNVSSETIFEVDGKEADVRLCPSSYETLSTRKNRTLIDNNNNVMLDLSVPLPNLNNKLAQTSEDHNEVIYEIDNRITVNVGGNVLKLRHCPASVLAIMCNARYGYNSEKETTKTRWLVIELYQKNNCSIERQMSSDDESTGGSPRGVWLPRRRRKRESQSDTKGKEGEAEVPGKAISGDHGDSSPKAGKMSLEWDSGVVKSTRNGSRNSRERARSAIMNSDSEHVDEPREESNASGARTANIKTSSTKKKKEKPIISEEGERESGKKVYVSHVFVGKNYQDFMPPTTELDRLTRNGLSETLTDVEQQYSQTKREALVVWGFERFHLYLYGKEFIVETDHKPLEFIHSPRSNIPARIGRWVMRLQPYKFKTHLDDSLKKINVLHKENTSMKQKYAELKNSFEQEKLSSQNCKCEADTLKKEVSDLKQNSEINKKTLLNSLIQEDNLLDIYHIFDSSDNITACQRNEMVLKKL
ncbi:unnamed protein product [Mytilus edulis]|uniref:Helicase ATP-binding domain-containing protein n=1 Tax=Mytilus edulis TaxID=6550 RepID=A0A8S3SJN3_MYTED|nr:unnamed protein product [Mytilus edulis]